MSAPERIGTLADGGAVQRVCLSDGRISLHLMSWGCVIQDLQLAGHAHSLVLGFSDFNDYPRYSPYFGATAGRYANRIARGNFEIGGRKFSVDRNENGRHHLHGGSAGLGVRNWHFTDVTQRRAVLAIDDPDGWMGYPGNCRLEAEFSLPGDDLVRIRYSGRTDRTTLVNLAHHSYFNLDGSPDILGHELQIMADGYLPIDDERIPSGEIAPVKGTSFDFRGLRQIGRRTGESAQRFDHNFCLSEQRMDLREVALLRSPITGIEMRIRTTEPGLQFYDGSMLNVPVPGLSGRQYGPHAGLCLEPQIWPDSPNHPDFPQAILHPGETYGQVTELAFAG